MRAGRAWTPASRLCPDTLEIDVDWSFVTDDTMFDESRSATLVAQWQTQASFSVEVPSDQLGGQYDVPADIEPGEYDTVEVRFHGDIASDGTTWGRVGGIAEGQGRR